jgi:hypothetical protein
MNSKLWVMKNVIVWSKFMNQLHLLVIDEIIIVNTRTLTFINHKLQVIKQAHNQFMGGIDVIMIGDFY